MQQEIDSLTGFSDSLPPANEFRRFLKVFLARKVVIFGLVIILIFLVSALFAPWLAPYDPYKQNLNHPFSEPGLDHFLGTDTLGRDTLSRIIYGSRTSLLVGVVTIFIASTLGLTLGLVAGYFGGIANAFIMRFIDALMSFPMLLLALVIAAVLGGGLINVMLAIGIALMSGYARIMCAQVLSVREYDFITAARAQGAGKLRIMVVHLIPNCLPPLIVLITMQMGVAILAEAGLSFLGIGIEPPGAAWGAMINDGYKYLLTYPILSFTPGIAIMLVVFAFNMVGDGLRDALDPRLRGII